MPEQLHGLAPHGRIRRAPGVRLRSVQESDCTAGGLSRLRRNLDLGSLTVLVSIADTHSVSNTAVMLRLSQPQISIALRRLRRVFNDPLFVRTGRGMQPTPRADEIVKSVRSVLAQIDDTLLVGERFDPATTERPFAFGLSDVCEAIVFPKVLPALRGAAPRAQIRSVPLCTSTTEIVSGLECSDIDLVIGYLPEVRRGTLYQQVLFTDTFAGLVRADHPIRSASLTLEQFLRLDHITSTGSCTADGAIHQFLARDRVDRRVALVSAHPAVLPNLVAASDTIAVVPRYLADHIVKFAPTLRQVALPFQLPTVEVCQYWHPRFHHDSRNRWLRALVAQVFHRGAAAAAADGLTDGRAA